MDKKVKVNWKMEFMQGLTFLFFAKRTGDDELYVNRRMVIVLNYCQYGVLYLGSYYNTGPYINFSFWEQ